MTQRQHNVLNMYNAVLQYLDENSGTWNEIIPVAEKQEQLKSTVNSINSKAEEQQGRSTFGYTAAKNVAMDNMLNLAYKMALKVKGFAKKTNDEVLLNSVDFSISKLESGTTREVINRCKLIAAAAEENLAGLAEYMVTDTDMAALGNAINNALPKNAERDSVRAARRGATLTLPFLFSQAGKEANDLDELIEGIIDNEDFVNGYFAARSINDMRGGRSRKEEAKAEVK